MPAVATSEGRIASNARKSLVLPVMHNIAVKVDEARDLVGPENSTYLLNAFAGS
jgi:hypothetical protein